MDHGDLAAMMKGVAPAIREFTQKAVSPVNERLLTIEGRIDELASQQIEKSDATLAVHKLIADMRDEWKRDKDLMAAEGRAMIAELQRENAELRATIKATVDGELARVVEIVSTLKDGAPGPQGDRGGPGESIQGPPGEPGPSGPHGKDGVDGKDADPAVIAEMVAAEVAKLPPAEPGRSVDPEEVRAIVKTEVAEAVAALPVPQDGKSVDPVIVARMVSDAVAEEVVRAMPLEAIRQVAKEELADAVKSLPVPADGHTPTEEELAPLIAKIVSGAVSELPTPKDGDPGPPGRDGVDGKDAEVTPEALQEAVTKYLTVNPPPAGRDGEPGSSGRDGVDGKDAEPITPKQIVEAVLAVPEAIGGAVTKHLTDHPPRDGRDADPVDYDVIYRRVDEKVAAIPVAKDGAGVRDLLIGRAGNLIGTRDDGTIFDAGVVVGKDGRDGKDVDTAELKAIVREEIGKIPVPKDGRDGRDAEPVEIFAPAEIAAKIGKAIGALNEMPGIPAPSPQIAPPAVEGGKTINMSRDAKGNLVAKVTPSE